MSSGRSWGGPAPPPPPPPPRPPPGAPAEPLDDPGLLFRRLEQADTDEAQQIKELFRENLRGLSGEAWLLNGLIDYYVSTGSARCLEILLSCGDGNSRAILDRLHQLLKSPDQRGAGLKLLGYYVRKHPVWLRKIVTQSSPCIVKDLFRIIKSDCEVQCIISAALVLTTLMPMFPVALIDFIQDLFQVLSRLTQMVSSPSAHLGQTYQLHLHVATYSYFVRIYAMYPCNLLSYLRQHYGQRDNLPLFNRTIRPLLDHVRMHPLLVTGSNSTETSSQRWQRKETHDIVAECSHFSLDILEASCMDNLSGPLWAVQTGDASADALGSFDVGLDGQEAFGIHDILWSPAAFCCPVRSPTSEQEPAGPAAAAAASSQEHCETAVEATPDTTPVPTPTATPLRDLENPPLSRPSDGAVKASRALNALVSGKSRGDSMPSSPLKKAPGAFRFGDGDQVQSFTSRLGQVLSERDSSAGGEADRRSPDVPPSPGGPGSSLSGLRDRRTSGKRSPIKLKLGVVSPVQFSEGAPPPVTRPVPRASEPGRAPPAAAAALWPDGGEHSAEDQEVSDLTRQPPAAATPGNLTPFASTTAQLTQPHPLRPAAAAPAAIPGRAAPGDGEDSPSPAPTPTAASLPQSFDLVRHMTRYYSQLVLPGRQLRRTSSCPDVAAPEPAAAAAAAPSRPRAPGRRADTETQTDDVNHPAPYEHLLAALLPPAQPSAQTSPSPHQLLREHVSLAGPNARLMHELLQYERYKREVHAHRNRRLFDRTRATRRMEEENRELKKQVQVMSVDVAECLRQLQLVKRQAARAAEEQRSAARRLQQQAAEDSAARQQLAAQLDEERRNAEELARQLRDREGAADQLRHQLLETERQLVCAQQKTLKKAELEARVLDLERRLLMMGQRVRETPETPSDPAAGGDPWSQLESSTPAPAPAPAASDEARRRAEAAATGLEQQLREKELTICELRSLMETVGVRHREQLQALEERYRATKEHLQAAETRLLLWPVPADAERRSNGAETAALPGKTARPADPGTGDLRAALGDTAN